MPTLEKQHLLCFIVVSMDTINGLRKKKVEHEISSFCSFSLLSPAPSLWQMMRWGGSESPSDADWRSLPRFPSGAGSLLCAIQVNVSRSLCGEAIRPHIQCFITHTERTSTVLPLLITRRLVHLHASSRGESLLIALTLMTLNSLQLN